MQRRTNSYGDNPLREEDLIKEYTEFKKKGLTEKDPLKRSDTSGSGGGDLADYVKKGWNWIKNNTGLSK